jgi:hypothetical protein
MYITHFTLDPILGPMAASFRTLVVSILASAAMLLLLSGGGVAEGDGDGVYTTIDVNFHHLGDHFVPTYQPQTPEGVEYNKDFQISGEIENPAIRMWVRGLVPPYSVSIDYVKLFINDVEIGYINEYAMGSGSIYDVDDEVEIEVSIEEGILKEGTNKFKIITGWGSSSSDRDDIMFWNIRLVRAKPLEMACNLVSPQPGRVHYPGLDTETVSIIVWNDRHVDALQWVRVTIDPGGADTTYRWTQNVNQFNLEAGAVKHASFPPNWHSSDKDLLNRTWVLTVTMSFGWTFPTDGPVDIQVQIRDDHTKMHTFTFEQVLDVRTGLELSGPVRLIAEDQGPLGPGSWVRGGEGLDVSVPPVVYSGSQDVYPPEGTVSVSLTWGGAEVAASGQGRGDMWTAGWMVPNLARATVAVGISLVDLPPGAGTPPPVLIDLEVDGRGPTWLSMAPDADKWLLMADVAPWADLTDNTGAGVDPLTLEFQTLDPATGEWGPWGPARLVMDGGEGGASRGVVALMLPEGDGHSIRWRAMDVLGNGPTESAVLTFGVDSSPVELEPFAEKGWITSNNVFVTCLVTDPDAGLGSSGVDMATVEVSVLRAGAEGWSEWMAPDSVVEVSGTATVQATVGLELAEGSGNFVRWRAQDTAGNELVVSPPDMLMVDTTLPLMVSQWPRGGTFDSAQDGRAMATFTDGQGSGVDPTSVEMSVSLGSSMDFSQWTPVEVTGDPEDLLKAEVDIPGLEGHDNWVMWRVFDAAGNGPVEFGPFRLMVNLPPTAAIASPQEAEAFGTEDIVSFSAAGSSDPDEEDQLTYEWWSNVDGHLGSGSEIKIPLTAGEHHITLYVDDGLGGEHMVQATVDVKVTQPTYVKEPFNFWLIILIILIVVATIATFRELRARKRRRLEGFL